MLKRPAPEQTALEIVTLEELVPQDQLLRKIDGAIDFSFIHDLTAPLYSPDNGRPPLDPTLMFKALFIGYLFGVRSERQLVRAGKPKGFFYLDHRTVDAHHAIITDTFATPANVHDWAVYLSRLGRQVERFGFQAGAVGLDAGYATPGIAKGLEERAVHGVTGYRNPTPPSPA